MADGTEFPTRGHINFTNPAFSTETGTFLVRASFANAQGQLRPGQFVRARVSGATRPNAILVPQRAVLQGAKSHFVWVVDNDSKAHQRVVEVGEWHGDDWFITEGLQAGRARGGRWRDSRGRRRAAENRRGAGCACRPPTCQGGGRERFDGHSASPTTTADEVTGRADMNISRLLHRPADFCVGHFDRHHARWRGGDVQLCRSRSIPTSPRRRSRFPPITPARAPMWSPTMWPHRSNSRSTARTT